MKKNRLFTFGCSHTQYKWPSWADIVALNYKEFYNFGQPGSGIFFMIYQFVFGNEHFKFNSDDTLIFMLSNESRLDISKENDWLVNGFVFNSVDIFGEKFFEHYSDIHAIESSYIYVYFLKEMLNKIGCKYEIIFAFPSPLDHYPLRKNKLLLNIWDKYFNCTNTKAVSLTTYAKLLNDSSYEFINFSGKKYKDGHYTILTHLSYVKKYLQNYYDEKNDIIVNNWEKTIRTLENKSDDIMVEKFKNITMKNKVRFTNGVMDNFKKIKLL